MSEFAFYGTARDCASVAQIIISAGHSLVPNRTYTNPECIALGEVDERFWAALRINRRFFVHGAFTESLHWVRINDSGFEIDPYSDGPLLILDFPLAETGTPGQIFKSGGLKLPRLLRNSALSRAAAPSILAKEAWTDIVRTLRKCLLRKKVEGGLPAWLGRDAWRVCERNEEGWFRVRGQLRELEKN
jgi:hypothetical protein